MLSLGMYNKCTMLNGSTGGIMGMSRFYHSVKPTEYGGVLQQLLRCAGDKDYLIDALALHDHMHLLHDVLADPGVLKVRMFLPVPLSERAWRMHICQLQSSGRPVTQSKDYSYYPAGWAHACCCAGNDQVVHGGENDTLWCQRDYHLYLVNLFDTEKACQVRS